MDRDQFWHLIEQSRIDTGSCEDQAEKLTALLGELESEEILGFSRQFNQCMSESFSWDLWAVGYIVNGGCSDDGFVYFRCWLISQGRNYFEAALKDPKRAADKASIEDEEYSECEDLLYCDLNAYKARTGKSEIPREPTESQQYDPVGEPWDEEDLPERFPELCRKFGLE